MIKRYGFLGTIYLPNEKDFSRRSVLKELPNQRYYVIKDEGESTIPEACYSLYKEDRLLAFIRGYFNDVNTFHIGRIENTTRKDQDKVPGSETLPLILEEMEFDLVRLGVRRITTHSLAWIAPIVVEKYGFCDQSGRTYEQLKRSILRWIPWKAVGLEKRLIE